MLDFSERQLLQEAEYNADQTELRALKYGSSHFDAGIEDDTMAGGLDDYEPKSLQMEDWAVSDATKDNAVGSIIEAIKLRSKILGNAYPFDIDGYTLKLRANSTNIVYRYCLAVSNAPTLTRGDYVGLPRVFEHVAGELSLSLLGYNANWIHTGWPRSHGLPSKFKDLVEEIKCTTTSKYEWTWSPEEGFADDDANKIKDSGIDFLVWKDFQDSRDGRLFFAGQCACGNDWVNKFTDINVKKLGNWVRPASWVPPVKILAIPYCSVEAYIHECSNFDNILLDRIRLSKLYDNYSTELAVEADMQRLIDLVLSAH